MDLLTDRRRRGAVCFLLFCAGAVFLAGCGGGGGPETIDRVERVPAEERIAPPTMKVAERMGLAAPASGGAAASAGAGMPAEQIAAGMGGAEDRGFTWELPEGWSQGPDSPMRLATFLIQSDPRAECVLSTLHGDAGGLEANVNRWRGQLGQPPLTPEEIAALPRWPVLGADAAVVEAAGPYTSMGGGTIDDALLLGVVCPMEGSTFFVKMTGTRAALEAERERFRAFCLSLRPAGGLAP